MYSGALACCARGIWRKLIHGNLAAWTALCSRLILTAHHVVFSLLCTLLVPQVLRKVSRYAGERGLNFWCLRSLYLWCWLLLLPPARPARDRAVGPRMQSKLRGRR